MKTKHLLFATALVASLAACTNDDFTIDEQRPVADGRPVVSDVRLNFTDDADTRLVYKGGYAWEANDTIGALLMDNVNTLGEDKTWLEKYTLTEFIHTSYPFTYSTADKTWGCNAKMLEGNYFFAFPWESYDGNRKVRHMLTKQEQKGVKKEEVYNSYAKNQFFIGYAQIKAGKNAKDVLTDVNMTSVLGGVQLKIVNTGTQTYHINKVVLRGEKMRSELTFNPTEAAYEPWNLADGNFFNYANYTGNKDDVYGGDKENAKDYVYNIGVGDEYNRREALRAVVKQSGEAKSAQLIITGTPAERALVSTKDDAEAVAYVMVMANAQKPQPATDDKAGELILDIYTDEGLVKGIDLTKINTADGNKYLATTDSRVEEIHPEKSNTIKVQIDDNSFAIPTEMEIFDSEDLLQFIEWNATVEGARVATAKLNKNVTLTKEMVEALAAGKNLSLEIESIEKASLAIAADVATDILENAKLKINADIEVLGTMNLTAKTNEFKENIIVAKNATLNIKEDGVVLKKVENNGIMNVNEGVTLSKGTSIKNNGVMNVEKLGDVKVSIENNATLNNNGYVIGLENARKDAVVVMGENANLTDMTNKGTIYTAKNAVVNGNNNEGEIVYVEGAKIDANPEGTISYETAGETFDEKSYKALTDNGANKIILKEGVTKIASSLTIADITLAEAGAELEVANGKTLTVTKLVAKAKTTTKGDIKAEDVEVEEGATLTNNGTITVSGTFTNNGTVANNGKVIVPTEEAAQKLNGTNWKYNKAETPKAPEVDKKQEAMDAAVEFWAEKWVNLLSNDSYYAGEPYSIGKFAATFDQWTLSGTDDKKAAAAALKSGFDMEESETFTSKFVKDDGTAKVTEFKTAVDKVLTADKFEELKKVIINEEGGFTGVTIAQDATLYKNETEAYDALRKLIAKATIAGVATDVAATAWKFSDTEIADALSASEDKVPYAYIWKGCNLDKLMTLWKTYSGNIGVDVTGNEYNDAKTTAHDEGNYDKATMMVTWVKKVLATAEAGNVALKEAQEALGELGIKILTIGAYGNYTNAQMNGLDSNLLLN